MVKSESSTVIYSISDITAEIRSLLEGVYSGICIEGEVTNLANPSSGHIYFSLKDARATIRCVMYRSVAIRQRFELRAGMQIIAFGRVSVYDVKGEYQFLAESIRQRGVGEVDLALQKLKLELQSLGYFAPDRKRDLPRYPKSIALVTSPSGAAVRDMLEILNKRWPATEVYITPVRVQGDGAAQEIAQSIRWLNYLAVEKILTADVIIIGRGGGSKEDLWAFNERVVADAIFSSVIPIISAVGHEIDVTIADMVADFRALTPSQAVTVLTPDREVLFRQLLTLRDRLHDSVRSKILFMRGKLEGIASQRSIREPIEGIRRLEQKLDDLAIRMKRAIQTNIEKKKAIAKGMLDQLESLGPTQVLKRGYSLVHLHSTGELVRSTEQVNPGELLEIRVNDGKVITRVEKIDALGSPFVDSEGI
jgi:exodeoxyribonuclease VII large subunit